MFCSVRIEIVVFVAVIADAIIIVVTDSSRGLIQVIVIVWIVTLFLFT